MSDVSRPSVFSRVKQQYQRQPMLMGGATVIGALLLFVWLSTPAQTRREGGARDPAKSGAKSSLDWVANILRTLENYPLGEITLQLTERLNQWIKAQPPEATWRVGEWLAGEGKVPETLREKVGFDSLPHLEFSPYDAIALQEAVWMRDIGNQVEGEGCDELTLAARLFDWTIRNVQLEDESEDNADLPWQVLLLGRGEARHRAWVFMLLARQQGLDVVMLAYPDPQDETKLRDWLPALLQGEELYLFDHRLALPIPGPDGAAVATLAQVAADESLLRQLDLDVQRPYRVKAAHLQDIVARIEASQNFLSARMHRLERALAGADKLTLSVDPGLLERRLKKCPRITDVRLWDWPYLCQLNAASQGAQRQPQIEEALAPFRLSRLMPKDGPGNRDAAEFAIQQFLEAQQNARPGQRPAPQAAESRVTTISRVLWKGRMLQFKGAAADPQDHQATYFFQLARPADHELATIPDMISETTAQLQSAPEESRVRMQRMLDDLEFQGRFFPVAKQHATYWLGLIAWERGDFELAAQHFRQRTLERWPDGPWTRGARYNLARCLESLDRYNEAIAVYESITSPQRHGNLLRARNLEKLAADSAKTTE